MLLWLFLCRGVSNQRRVLLETVNAVVLGKQAFEAGVTVGHAPRPTKPKGQRALVTGDSFFDAPLLFKLYPAHQDRRGFDRFDLVEQGSAVSRIQDYDAQKNGRERRHNKENKVAKLAFVNRRLKQRMRDEG